MAPPGPQQHRICMVCDFFCPRLGGVEMHIWSLAQCLLARGHHVIVATHAYPGGRRGVRYMSKGLKVYYCPLYPVMDACVLPSVHLFLPMLRQICARERITCIHAHQAMSTMGNEALLYARLFGLGTVYTDHSLFGLSDISSMNINKVLTMSMLDVDHAICVSNTCRENLVLRAKIEPSTVSVIPNAVDASRFEPRARNGHGVRRPGAHSPAAASASPERVNVVIVSRLVYRKGMDLVARVVPLVCARHPNVHFIIGGDGPKRLLIDEMREKCVG